MEPRFRIPIFHDLVKYWGLFHRFVGNRLLVFIALSLMVTLLDGVGITLFFPLFLRFSSAQEEPASAGGSALMNWISGALESAGLAQDFGALLVTVVGIFFFKASCQFLAGAYQAAVTVRFMRGISNSTFHELTAVRYRAFLDGNLGSISNMLVNETNRAMVAFLKYASLFPPLITISVFTLLAFGLSWRVTLAAIAFGAAMISCLWVFSRMARSLSHLSSEAYGDFNALVIQTFSAFKYLSATGRFRALREQVGRAIDRVALLQYRLSLTSLVSQVVNEPAVVFFLVAMIWQQAVKEGNPISQVLVLGLVFFRLIKELMSLQSSWHGFSATLGSIDLLMRTAESSAKEAEPVTGEAVTSLGRGIELRGVSFAYGQKAVLSDISLTIARNSCVAFVGESGSGKSTLVDLVTGLLSPSAGSLSVDGRDLSGVDKRSFRRLLGYVSQDTVLFNDTIANNISLWNHGPGAASPEVIRAAEQAQCASFIKDLKDGYETQVNDRGSNFSGGQRQRLAIARELFKQPELLILDEATSALDALTEQEVQAAVEALRGKMTIIMISHRLATIARADRIFFLRNGRIEDQGTFAELRERNPQFRELCAAQRLA